MAPQVDNQTAQVLLLALDVLPGTHRERTYQRLIDAIHARKDHMGTGTYRFQSFLADVVK